MADGPEVAPNAVLAVVDDGWPNVADAVLFSEGGARENAGCLLSDMT